MENQTELEKGIGTKEPEILKPAKVKIEKVELRDVKKMRKVVCTVKHPEQDTPIEISRVKYQKKDNLKTVGLWYKEDEDELLQKGTALAQFLTFVDAKNIKELEGKEVETLAEDNGYLCFKAY